MSSWYMAGVIISWLIFSAAVGDMAARYGRRRLTWFLLSLLISPLTAIMICLLLGKVSDHMNVITEESHARCLECAELIRREAKICPYCRSETNGQLMKKGSKAPRIAPKPVVHTPTAAQPRKTPAEV